MILSGGLSAGELDAGLWKDNLAPLRHMMAEYKGERNLTSQKTHGGMQSRVGIVRLKHSVSTVVEGLGPTSTG
jgi:hypothetical protein